MITDLSDGYFIGEIFLSREIEVYRKKGLMSIKKVPLSSQRNLQVGMTRFELATPSSRTKCSTKLSHIPIRKKYYSTDML